MKFSCAHCGEATDRPTGHVNRARARGMKLFCGNGWQLFFGKDWHETKELAVADAERRRIAKIVLLTKQIEKLRALHFS